MVGALPANDVLAGQLELLADLSEILGEQGFRIRAYRTAASRIRETPVSVAQLAVEGRATELGGIGRTIESKIVEVVEDGEMHALAKRRLEVPGEVASFLRLPGLGPKTAARIWRELDVTSLDALRRAASEGRLRGMQGLGPRSEEKILAALEQGVGGDEQPRRGLLGIGLPVVREVVRALAAHPGTVAVSEAGSARRRRETFRDLDVIATATDPAALTSFFTTLPGVLEVVAHGDTKATVVTQQGFRLDLRVVPPECYGDLLQHFTGSKEHNIALREEAVRRGLSVSEYGVTVVETGEVKTFATETELYAFLGYQFVAPELRENSGELEAARRDALPVLVEPGDLRGEMHCHSTWSSDGKDTVEAMAMAARARGYRFVVITDHSHYLRDGRLHAQWAEIEALDGRLRPFRVLRGIEANIRVDGSVDVADEELAQLDWVVASLHTSFDRNPTERVLAAIDNPHVDCIGHLTGRKLSRAQRLHGAPVDVEVVVARAAETGTALEINSQPGPARPAGRPRAAGRGGGRARAGEHGRALHRRARVRRARSGTGPPRLAHEAAGAQYAHVGADCEAAQVSGFRADGAAALDWVAAYLEHVGDYPVLSQVAPGQIRAALTATPPDDPEPFSAVLADLDRVLLPGMTHWQSPRYFAYFANTGSEPGILAELLAAGLNQIGILWRTSPALQELEELTVDWLRQLLGLPEGLVGHIEDSASTGTLAALLQRHVTRHPVSGSWSPRSTCTRRSTRRAASSSSSCERSRSTRPSGCCADALDLEGRVRGRGSHRDDLDEAPFDPVPAIADACEAAGVWLHVDAAYAGSAGSLPRAARALRGLGAGGN